jgi:hypothetical protein
MTRPASVFDLADDLVLPPANELITDRPSTLIGLPIEWTRSSKPVPVFISSFDLAPGVDGEKVYLFGARQPMRDCVVDGESWGVDGFFMEYYAIDANPGGGWNVHRLRQRGHSVVYADRDEDEEDCVQAKTIADPIVLSIRKPPAWKLWAAEWPTCDGKPMRFVGQVKPPKNEVTEELLEWVSTLYLFCAQSAEGTRYKLVKQDRGAQTAEEHYELEDQLEGDK